LVIEFVLCTGKLVTIGREEITDTLIATGLQRASLQKEAGSVDFRGRLPRYENMLIAGIGCKRS
jgi:hypothetical protein